MFLGEGQKVLLAHAISHIPSILSIHYAEVSCFGQARSCQHIHVGIVATYKVKGCSIPGSVAQMGRPAFPANTSSLIIPRKGPHLDYGAHVHLQLIFVPISSPRHHFSTFSLHRLIFSD